MLDKNAMIAVFDSGVGGLTVLKELLEIMPNENFLYFGDTARIPYGSRTSEEIRSFTAQIFRFLTTQKVKLAVIACNTITFTLLPQDKEGYPYPIIGMNTGMKVALAGSINRRVGVIATEATVRSAKHVESGKEIDPQAEVYLQACPKFVPLIEQGIFSGPEMEEAAHEYLASLQKADVDATILACTHYPMIKDLVGGIMGEKVTIVNPAYETALDAQRLLAGRDMLNSAKEPGKLRIAFSSVTDENKKLAQHFLQRPLPEIETVDASAY